MAVALADFGLAVSFIRKGAGLEDAGPSAKAHGAAHFVDAEEFTKLVNHAIGCLRIELSAVRLVEAGAVAGVFNGGALHSQADSEERSLVLAGVVDGVDHALNATLPETARNEDAIVAAQKFFGSLEAVDFLGFNPIDDGFVVVGETAVEKGFAQTLVSIFELDILADDANAYFAFGMMEALQHVEPRLHIGRTILEAEQAGDLCVEAFLAEFHRDFVNGFHIFHGDHAGFVDIAEESDLAFQVNGNVAIAAAQQDVGLNPDAEHFLDAVLRGLGFEFTGSGDVRDQSNVNEKSVFGAEFEAHLADSFEEGQGFDVANSAADLDDDDVDAFGDAFDAAFDFVGDVGNHLDSFAEVVATAFFGEDGFVDTAGGPVVVASELGVGEAFVMAKVEISFGAVFGNENFAVLVRAHGTGIDIQVRIAFLNGDLETTTFEETTDRGSSNALTERGNNTASYKDIFWRHPGSRLRRSGFELVRPPQD